MSRVLAILEAVREPFANKGLFSYVDLFHSWVELARYACACGVGGACLGCGEIWPSFRFGQRGIPSIIHVSSHAISASDYRGNAAIQTTISLWSKFRRSCLQRYHYDDSTLKEAFK